MRWASPVTLTSTCSFDISNFPYDTQTCKLKFGPWLSDVSLVDLHPDSRLTVDNSFVPNSEWQLLSVTSKRNLVKYACCEIPFSDVTVTFKMSRRPLFYWFNLVGPCVILLCCLLIGYFVPPHSGERVTLSLTVLLAFAIFIQTSASYLPKSSYIAALEILYFVVMIQVALSSLATCVIVNVYYQSEVSEVGMEVPMPKWVENWVLNGIGSLFTLNWLPNCKFYLDRRTKRDNHLQNGMSNTSRNINFSSDEFLEYYGNIKTCVNEEKDLKFDSVELIDLTVPSEPNCIDSDIASIEGRSIVRNEESGNGTGNVPAGTWYQLTGTTSTRIRRSATANGTDHLSRRRGGKLGHTACCLEDNFRLANILETLRQINHNLSRSAQEEQTSDKWKELAYVLDRLFFLLFFISIFLTLVIILFIQPTMKN